MLTQLVYILSALQSKLHTIENYGRVLWPSHICPIIVSVTYQEEILDFKINLACIGKTIQKWPECGVLQIANVSKSDENLWWSQWGHSLNSQIVAHSTLEELF